MMSDATPSTESKVEQDAPSQVNDGNQDAGAVTVVEEKTTSTEDEVVSASKPPKRKKATVRGKSRKTTRGRKTTVFAAKTKTSRGKTATTRGRQTASASPEVEESVDKKSSTRVGASTGFDIENPLPPPQKPRKKRNIGSVIGLDVVFCLIMGLSGIAILALRGDLEAKHVAPYQAEVKRLELVIDPSLAKKKEKKGPVYRTGFTHQQQAVEPEPEAAAEPEPLPPSPQQVSQAKLQLPKVRALRDRHETYFRRAGYVGVVALILAIMGVIGNILLSHRRVEGYSLAWVAVVLTSASILLMVPIVVVPPALKASWVTALVALALFLRVCWNSYYGYSLYSVKDEFEAIETRPAEVAVPSNPHRTGRGRRRTQTVGRKTTTLVPKQKRQQQQQVVLAGKR